MNEDFRYSIDLSTAQARAEKIIECIKRFRERTDFRRFEYTSHVRIAPTEVPHSQSPKLMSGVAKDMRQKLAPANDKALRSEATRMRFEALTGGGR